MKLAVIFGTEVPCPENYYKKYLPDGSSVKSAVWRCAEMQIFHYLEDCSNNQLNDALTACMCVCLQIEWGA